MSVISTFRGDEQSFTSIRKFIKEGGLIDNFVTQSSVPILTFPHPNIRPKGWGHVLLFENINNILQVRIQFFLGPNYNPPVYVVRLSDDKISVEDSWKGHYFSYFESGPIGNYNGEVSELTCGKLK